MGEELNTLKELWRTGKITDAQFMEKSTSLSQGVKDRNGALLRGIRGPLVVIKYTKGAPTSGEDVTIVRGDSTKVTGEVLEISRQNAVLQVFEGTSGIDDRTSFELTRDVCRLPVSESMLGRAFNGVGKSLDRGPPISAQQRNDIQGKPVNPIKRTCPNDVIHTGVSAIDVTCPLYRGATLPIFSAAGLPHHELASQIVRNAKIKEGKSVIDFHEDNMVIIVATIGASAATVRMYKDKLQDVGRTKRTIFFAGTENQPYLESLRVPHVALTAAEYFAVERELNVLVVSGDYEEHYRACAAVATGKDQLLPKGAPYSYYSDISKIFERSGRFAGSNGSITHIPILTLRHEDITRCTPDTCGSLADGFIYLSRPLYNRNVFPPIDVLQSSSRFFKPSISQHTRNDHYLAVEETWRRYTRAVELEQYCNISSEQAPSAEDRYYLRFKDDFVTRFVTQGENESRSIDTSLDILCDLLT